MEIRVIPLKSNVLNATTIVNEPGCCLSEQFSNKSDRLFFFILIQSFIIFTGGVPEEISEKSIENVRSTTKKRFGNRKNGVSAKKRAYKRFANKSDYNRRVLSSGPGNGGVRKISSKTPKAGSKYGKMISRRAVKSANPTPCWLFD